MNPTFIMMVGLPYSGKSYYAEKLSKEYGAVVYSSDAIRAEILGDVQDQNNNGKVFEVLHRRVYDDLSNGKSVIYTLLFYAIAICRPGKCKQSQNLTPPHRQEDWSTVSRTLDKTETSYAFQQCQQKHLCQKRYVRSSRQCRLRPQPKTASPYDSKYIQPNSITSLMLGTSLKLSVQVTILPSRKRCSTWNCSDI